MASNEVQIAEGDWIRLQNYWAPESWKYERNNVSTRLFGDSIPIWAVSRILLDLCVITPSVDVRCGWSSITPTYQWLWCPRFGLRNERRASCCKALLRVDVVAPWVNAHLARMTAGAFHIPGSKIMPISRTFSLYLVSQRALISIPG